MHAIPNKTRNVGVSNVCIYDAVYFTPLLYQVATGFLEPSNISYPFRKLVNAKGFNFRQGELSSIGDISIQFTDPAYPNGHPQLAQPAIQQGKALARNLNAFAKGKKQKPFKYFDRGDMAIIGKSYAVADLFKHKLHLGGLLGLLAWLFIHVISLVNFNNKVKTLYNWAIAYVTSNPSLRMSFQAKDKRQQFRAPLDRVSKGSEGKSKRVRSERGAVSEV
jgi:NADH dehydrogenase FAD-containing subunit